MSQPDRQRKLFEVFVRENEASLVTYLRSLVRDPGLVDDLFQETLITAWRKFDDFDPSRPLGPWLRGIAINLVRNANRKRSRDLMVVGDDVAGFVERAVAAVDQIEGDSWDDRLTGLRACLNQLTKRSRELVRQRYALGWNAHQIAECNGEASATVRKRLQRTRETLFHCIKLQLGEIV